MKQAYLKYEPIIQKIPRRNIILIIFLDFEITLNVYPLIDKMIIKVHIVLFYLVKVKGLLKGLYHN